MQEIEFSVVIPLNNEEENIQPLLAEIKEVMTSLKAAWELICVDDGSKDATRRLLEEAMPKLPQLRPLFFDRNYGQSSAFDAGFKAARGKFVITIDGDLQNDPNDIPKLLRAAQTPGKKVDLVCGCRVKRQDNFFRRFITLISNAVRQRVCLDGVKDTGCSLKVYRKEALEKIKMFQGMHRFLPALFIIEGLSIEEIAVNHRPRISGKTKYNLFNRSFNTIVDMLAVRWMRKRALCYRFSPNQPGVKEG